jgi:hypothetical protein
MEFSCSNVYNKFIVFKDLTIKPWFDTITSIYFVIHRLVLKFYIAYEGIFSVSFMCLRKAESR